MIRKNTLILYPLPCSLSCLHRKLITNFCDRQGGGEGDEDGGGGGSDIGSLLGLIQPLLGTSSGVSLFNICLKMAALSFFLTVIISTIVINHFYESNIVLRFFFLLKKLKHCSHHFLVITNIYKVFA